MSVCDVVIPIWNQQERTRACLESILRCGRHGLRLVLVDNGSDAPTREFLEQFRADSPVPVELIRNPANAGFIKAVNQGILAGSSSWICILNNDTIVTDGWMAEMMRVAESSPRIGLVNPTSNSLGFHVGSVGLEAFARGLRSQTGIWTELSTALGFCLLARRSLLQEVGLLDERYGMGNFDDDDLSRRVKAKGLLCVRACAAYVYHEEKVSFRELTGWEAEFEKNRRRFEERWGRRLRILWTLSGQVFPEAEEALALAREGHWITFIAGRDGLPPSLLSHAQVGRIESSSADRMRKTLWRLLTKRKKPFDLLITADPSCGRWARLLRPFHRAQVLIRPEAKEISETCQALCRSRSRSALEEARPLPAATSFPLSVVVITKNEESRLRDCLDSVSWAGEIVVVDDESTDRTVGIAREHGAHVIVRRMEVEGRHRNFAYAQARNDWVLSLDADERVTPELREEITRLFSGSPTFPGYTIPRRNFLGKRWIRYGGWYPSPQLKLFRKDRFRYEESEVHPRAFMDGDSGRLTQDLIHFSYRDLSDFLSKLNRQTTLEARKWLKDGRAMPSTKALWRTLDRFFRSLLIKQGYRDGWAGLIVAAYAGFYQFLSFAKYWHLKTQGQGADPRRAGAAPPRSAAAAMSQPTVHRNGAAQRLSVVVLCKNAEALLPQCLRSVSWADEVIVVDGGSTDASPRIAREAGAQLLLNTTPDNFAELRNAGMDQAAGDWVLQLDADEVVTPEFRQALEQILKGQAPHAAYKFRRRNNFLGHWMRFGGWDHHSLHLFRRGRARYQGRVHERLEVQGSIGVLDVGVEHYPFRSLEEFVDRQNRYTTLQARQLLEERGSVSRWTLAWNLTVKPLKLLWKILIRKGGRREGTLGFLFAGLFAFVHFLQWAKLWELQDANPS